jgi:hypothetical protein
MTKKENQQIQYHLENFNRTYPERDMLVKQHDNTEWYTLSLDNVALTSGSADHILKRVKQINRENGI